MVWGHFGHLSLGAILALNLGPYFGTKLDIFGANLNFIGADLEFAVAKMAIQKMALLSNGPSEKSQFIPLLGHFSSRNMITQ